MVTAKVPRKIDIRRVLSTLRSRSSEERRQRQVAEPRLLSPTDVRGDYDIRRALLTTLGGHVRPITGRDIQAFQRNVKTLGKNFKGGITARKAIDLSRPTDRARSNKEIHTAVPLRIKGADLTVVTNAGPDSGHSRHVVVFGLLNMPAAVANPKRAPELARFVTGGPITLECDCEDFRYRKRYLATVGGFVHGRPEPAYTKFTNPTLSGCLCKHLLRACHNMDIGLFRKIVVDAIVGQRATLDQGHQVRLTQKQVDDHSNRRVTAIRTTSEREARATALRRFGIADAVARQQKAAQQSRTSIAATERNVRRLLATGGISQEAFNTIMQALKTGTKVGG